MQALGAWLVVSGDGSPGILVACTILLGRALSPVEQVVGSWRVLAEGLGVTLVQAGFLLSAPLRYLYRRFLGQPLKVVFPVVILASWCVALTWPRSAMSIFIGEPP